MKRTLIRLAMIFFLLGVIIGYMVLEFLPGTLKEHDYKLYSEATLLNMKITNGVCDSEFDLDHMQFIQDITKLMMYNYGVDFQRKLPTLSNYKNPEIFEDVHPGEARLEQCEKLQSEQKAIEPRLKEMYSRLHNDKAKTYLAIEKEIIEQERAHGEIKPPIISEEGEEMVTEPEDDEKEKESQQEKAD